MKKRRIKKKAIISALILLVLIVLGTTLAIYEVLIGPVGSNTIKKEFEVPSGVSYSTLGAYLKKENLIKNELAYKIYIRLNNPSNLQAGKYLLSNNMSLEEIIEELSKGSTYNPDAVTLSVAEGKHLEELALIASNITNNSKEDLISSWDNIEFVKEVIEKYWFITDEVLNSKIRHPLEGYLFPSTYELLNKDVDASYIAYKMLDKMDSVLTKYKSDIEASKYSVHEILTMASIVEYEAILDEDRPLVASVFYNRLDINMKLQSCATLGYATGEWKLTYTYKDMDIISPYNTYMYQGLPIGPGGMPGEKSIEAAIYPSESSYYYFMANVCDTSSKKTYFSKTLSEHESKVKKYLTCF